MIVLKEKGMLAEGNVDYGASTFLWKDFMLVASPKNSTPLGSTSGIVYLYRESTGELLHTFMPEVGWGRFGASLFMNDDYIVIGADYEERPDWGTLQGAVYFFDAVTYELIEVKTTPTTMPDAMFGQCLAGNTTHIAIGASGHEVGTYDGAGAVFVYDLATRSLVTQINNPLEAANPAYDYFGEMIAMTDTFLAIACPYEYGPGSTDSEGSVRIYNTSTWAFIKRLYTTDATKPYAYFGIGMSAKGNTLVVTTHNQNSLGGYGTAIIWDDVLTAAAPYDAEPASSSYTLKAVAVSDGFIAISQLTGTIESVMVRDRSTKAVLRTFSKTSGITGNTGFGARQKGFRTYQDKLLLGAEYEMRIITDPKGAAYTFDLSTGDQRRYIKNPAVFGESSNDGYGANIAVSNNRLAISTKEVSISPYMRGSIFLYDTATMALIKELKDSNYAGSFEGMYGTSMVIDNQILVVGSPTKWGTANKAGVINVYSSVDGTHLGQIGDPGTVNANEYFGTSLALTTNYIAVGAEGNINGVAAGSVFFFSKSTRAYSRVIHDPAPAASNYFGRLVRDNGQDRVVVSAPGNDIDGANSGRIYHVDINAGSVLRTFQNPTPAHTGFGEKMVVNSGKLYVAVANFVHATGVNKGYVLVYNISTGELLKTLVSPKTAVNADKKYGYSLDVRAGYIAITEADTVTEQGEIFIYNEADNYNLVQVVENPNGYPDATNDDRFGFDRIVMDADYLYVSAIGEDSEKGVDSGAVYVFKENEGTFDTARVLACKPFASNMDLETAKAFTLEFEELTEGLFVIRNELRLKSEDFLFRERSFLATVSLFDEGMDWFMAKQEVTSEALADAMAAFENLASQVNYQAGQTINLFDIKSANLSKMTDDYKQQVVALSKVADGLALIGKLVSEDMKSIREGKDALAMMTAIFSMIKKKLFILLKTANDKYYQIDELFTIISDAAYILEKSISSNKAIKDIFNMPEQERTAFFNERYY